MIEPRHVSRGAIAVITTSVVLGVGAVAWPSPELTRLDVDSRVPGQQFAEGEVGDSATTSSTTDATGSTSTTVDQGGQPVQSTVVSPTSAGEVPSTTVTEGSDLDPATSTTEVQVTAPTTVPGTIRVPGVDWQCVGDYLYGDAGQTSTPSYNLAVWQSYGGEGLPEEHPELWATVAQNIYEGESMTAPEWCVS